MDTLKKLMEINIQSWFLLIKSGKKIKKYKEFWSKIRDLIRVITKNSYDYDEKYMKIKFNLDNMLLLNKTVEIPSMTIIVRAVFHDKHFQTLSPSFL